MVASPLIFCKFYASDPLITYFFDMMDNMSKSVIFGLISLELARTTRMYSNGTLKEEQRGIRPDQCKLIYISDETHFKGFIVLVE